MVLSQISWFLQLWVASGLWVAFLKYVAVSPDGDPDYYNIWITISLYTTAAISLIQIYAVYGTIKFM